MTADEASTLARAAFPGATVRSVKGVCEIVAKDGTVLGRAFSWRPALQQAVKPLLDAKQKEAAEAWEERKKDFDLFLEFLRGHLRGEFEEWKVKNGHTKVAAPADPSGDAGRAQADQAQLVQEHAAGERPREDGPSRLILLGG